MYTMFKKYSEDERLQTDWTWTVCVKDWGCVKDQSETVPVAVVTLPLTTGFGSQWRYMERE
jgi:hypothetical protein